MVICIIGESCTGKTTFADKLTQRAFIFVPKNDFKILMTEENEVIKARF